MNPRDLVWPAIRKHRPLAEEVSAEIAAEIREHKARLEALDQDRNAELAEARYGEDYECTMYPKPEHYKLDCGCVYCVRTAQWEKDCPKHEDLR